MSTGLWIFLAIATASVIVGISSAIANNILHQYARGRDRAFKNGFLAGRQWLAEFIAESEAARDVRDVYLAHKSHPAKKSAAVVSEIKAEKRELAARCKFLEYQLKSYEEYFPQLEEFRELILDERIPLTAEQDNVAELEAADPAEKFLSRKEWERLSPAARNQLALDRYLQRSKANWEIGRFYERYLGYLWESRGWIVTFHGALFGLEDLGRDLICCRDSEVEIIQAKYWSKAKVIHEKHLFQLFGSTIHYRLAHPESVVTPVLATTTELSDVAKEAAKVLGVRVESIPCPAVYPMIKCNINMATKERIYHLPFDQQYDRTRIINVGECYVTTVREAEKLGFRRAWRHRQIE